MASNVSVEESVQLPSDLIALNDLFQRNKKLCKYLWGILKNSLRNGRNLNSVSVVAYGETGSGKSTTINKIFNDKSLCATGNLKSTTTAISIIRKKMVVRCSPNSASVMGYLCFIDTPGTFDSNGNDKEYMELLKSFRENDPLLASPKPSSFSYVTRGPTIRSKIYPNIVLFFINADSKIVGENTRIHESLRKLKFADLVDPDYRNLIVVVTRGLQFLGGAEAGSDTSSNSDEDDDDEIKVFCTQSQIFKEAVRKAVQAIFGFDDCPIAIVENRGHGVLYRDPNTDYYKLPNGELSHHNVLLYISQVFRASTQFNDTLGQLLVGSYLDVSCPERKQTATVNQYISTAYSNNVKLHRDAFIRKEMSQGTSSNHEYLPDRSVPAVKHVKAFNPEHHPLLRKMSSQFLEDSEHDFPFQDESSDTTKSDTGSDIGTYSDFGSEPSIPQLSFEYLAHGITFLSGEIKPTNLLGTDQCQIISLGNNEYRISKAISIRTTNTKIIESAIFNRKATANENVFIQNMRRFLPMLQSTSNFRIHTWNSAMEKNQTIYCYVFERSLAACSLEEPEIVLSKCTMFSKDVQDLVENSAQEVGCQSFLERWGSDFVTKQDVGGAIYAFARFQPSYLKKTVSRAESFKASLDVEFNSLFSNPTVIETQLTKSIQKLRKMGIKDEQIVIKGGQIDALLYNFDSLHANVLAKWHTSVENNPASIMGGLSFFPHYLLLRGETRAQVNLKVATASFTNKIAKTQFTQKEMANYLKNQASMENEKIGEEENCFPKGTIVYVNKVDINQSKQITTTPIQYLFHGDHLLSVNVDAKLNVGQQLAGSYLPIISTRFCTFLHKAPIKQVNYVCLRFSNEKDLIVSENHLIISVEGSKIRVLRAVQLAIGDFAIFASPSSSNQGLSIEIVTCIQISRRICLGAFAPLTSNGTFFANGFLVTCYAGVNSFTLANLFLAPLRLSVAQSEIFYTCKSTKRRTKLKNPNLTSQENADEIHPYAKALMKLRTVGKFLMNKRSAPKITF